MGQARRRDAVAARRSGPEAGPSAALGFVDPPATGIAYALHAMPRARASTRSLPSQVDIAIVTILQEEYDAVKRRLKNVRRDPGTRDQPNQYAWLVGEIEAASGGTYQVVLAMTLHPGNTSGSLGTGKTVARWRPRYVLLVGIAGGLPREQLALGDVIVSKQIVSYEYGKVEHNAFNPRPDFVYQSDGPLLRGASSLGEADWRNGLGRRPNADRAKPKLRVGIVGSGEKVIDDRSSDFFAAVEKAFSKLLAVEMEGAGAAAAIQEGKDEGRSVGFLMIRGISDMPPDKKTRAKKLTTGTKKDATAVSDRDQWKSYAANAAASFAVCFVSQAWPLPPRGTRETPAGVSGEVRLPHGTPPKDHMSGDALLLERYLRRSLTSFARLPLGGVDPKSASDADIIELHEVYTALRTDNFDMKSQAVAAHDQAWQDRFSKAGIEYGTMPRHRYLRRRGDDADTERLFEPSQMSALGALDEEARLMLLGDPGSGKSMFASFIATCLAGEALGHKRANIATMCDQEFQYDRHGRVSQRWRHGALVPLRVVLRDFAARGLPGPGESATVQHLWRFLEREGLAEFVPALKRVLDHRGGLSLFDGLDEVPEADQRRAQIKQVVQDVANSYSCSRVLVTCRTYAFQHQEWALAGFSAARILPFSSDQITDFVERWYAHVGLMRGLRPDDAAGRAETLKHAIFRSDRLQELAQWPLLLTLMASLHAWRGGTLPDQREELYADAVDLLLDWWEGAKVVRDKDGNAVVEQPSLSEWLRADQRSIRALLSKVSFEAHSSQVDLRGTADIAEEKVGRQPARH